MAPDEEIFLRYLNAHREWKLIIAPHVIGEDHLQQIEKLLEGRKVIRYTKSQQLSDTEVAAAEVLIIDCFGLLSSIYHYGQVAYVGGGFGVSIHNLPEAAVWSIPVIFGPENQKFQEAQELKTCKGGFEIKGYEDFAQLMDRFDSDATFLKEAGQNAGNYVKGKSRSHPENSLRREPIRKKGHITIQTDRRFVPNRNSSVRLNV